MAISSFLPLSLCFLVFFHRCFAQIEQTPWHARQQPQQQQQQHRLHSRSECRIENLDALEPNRRDRSEAGITEFWDENNEQFECAGVAAVRHVIQPRGLLLPYFSNAPRLSYIVQGRGVAGAVFPGCAETYQSQSSSQSRGDRSQRSGDQHQKVRNLREGDIIALPAGVAQWTYNNGDEPLVAVTLFDTSNDANQLDQNVRRFFLAGNPNEEQQGGSGGRSERGRQGRSGRNIFSGFDEQILANAFDVETELVQRIQNQNDKRGNIVRVRDELQVISPEDSREEEEEEERRRRGRPNGIEETFCTMRLKQNIADPSRADVYNPRGGRITSLNSQRLPILSYLQLSVERGVLYRDGILAPQWSLNAHSAVYITRGNGRLQIVGDNGQTVFDGQVQEGQFVIVPQNFAVVKKAGRQGLEWVAFKTNDNAMTNPLAGRLSVIRGLPEEVLTNSYDISREDARKLKFNREEFSVFSPGSRSQGRVEG